MSAELATNRQVLDFLQRLEEKLGGVEKRLEDLRPAATSIAAE